MTIVLLFTSPLALPFPFPVLGLPPLVLVILLPSLRYLPLPPVCGIARIAR